MTEARITHIGGPTALIEAGGWRILTDPTFDPPGKRYFFGWGTTSKKLAGPSLSPAEVGDIDAVLISHHHHGDNLDPTGRALLPRWGTVVTTQKAARHLGAGIGLRPWETTTLQAPGRPTITVTATPCRHGPPGMDPITGPVIGFSLRWEGQEHGELWITGDTVLYPRLREVPQRLNIGTVVAHLGAVRFAYLTGPFRYSMDGREAAELMSLVRPTSVIPVHYEGWSHFKQDRPQAEPELAALGDAVHWVDPGESTLVVV